METNTTVCRLCLVPEDPDAMAMLSQNDSFAKQIFQIVQVTVGTDDIDEYLCQSCQSILEQIVEFRETCISNDSIYRKMYSSSDVDDDTTNDDLEEPLYASQLLSIERIEPVEFEQVDVKELPEQEASDQDVAQEFVEDESSVPQSAIEKEPTPRKTRKKSSTNKMKRPQKTPVPRKQTYNKVACQQCGKMVSSRNISKHQEIHEPDRRKLLCPHCPKFYYDTKTLKEHVNAIHTHEIQYTCDRCGKVYNRANSLKEHVMASHSDIKPFECKICGQRFARSSLASHHKKIAHSTVRAFACEYCDKTFKTRSDWTIHTRIHTGEKPFKCDLCDKRFNKSYNVVIHKKSHRNEMMRANFSDAATLLQ